MCLNCAPLGIEEAWKERCPYNINPLCSAVLMTTLNAKKKKRSPYNCLSGQRTHWTGLSLQPTHPKPYRQSSRTLKGTMPTHPIVTKRAQHSSGTVCAVSRELSPRGKKALRTPGPCSNQHPLQLGSTRASPDVTNVHCECCTQKEPVKIRSAWRTQLFHIYSK